MTGALIILVATALIGFVLWLLDRLHKKEEPEQEIAAEEPAAAQDEECCGMHAVCEKQLLSPVTADFEYFDDEELDAYRGRDADSYTDAETEQFRDVLLTLRPDDVAAWSKSIQLRGITLPAPVRDELIMIVSDLRSKSTNP